jgi:ABC-type lipoprotein export system ATPase subunit
MVTHEMEYGRETDRIIHLEDGYIDKDERLR